MIQKWTPQEEMLLRMAKQFTENEIAPFDLEIDHSGQLPDGLFNKMVKTGFLGVTLPEEFGGAHFGPQVTAELIRIIAAGSASVAVILEGHYKTIDQFVKFATTAIQAKYLPLASQKIFGYSMTEPSGGSTPMGIRTTAIHEGSEWVLNGNKAMITNGGLAEVYCVLTKTAPDELSTFVVDSTMPGFKFGKQEDFVGLRGLKVGEIFLNDVRIPDEALMGNRGEGLYLGDVAHDDARILMGAVMTGIMDHALDLAATYANERKALDKPIGSLQAIQQKLADIAMGRETTRLLYQEAAGLKAMKRPYSELATMAKAYGSRTAVKAADDALQIYAGYGYSREYPLAHLVADARAAEIMEGTVEKMRGAIALEELKSREDR